MTVYHAPWARAVVRRAACAALLALGLSAPPGPAAGAPGPQAVEYDVRVLAAPPPLTHSEGQGWGPSFVVPIHARIDAPDRTTPVHVGAPVLIKGIAFAGNRGVSGVEVSTDGGATWEGAHIDYPGTRLTWALWSREWRPAAAGTYELVARAADGAGVPQTALERPVAPQGATGYHRLPLRVTT